MNKEKLGKFIKVISALFVLCFAFFVLTDLYVVKVGKEAIKDKDDINGEYDCILVLGAGVYNNETPSLMLKERLDTAAELYEAGFSEKILVSGDHGRDEYDEVNVMKSYLEDKNIPSENIFMDHAGFSTYETMYRAKEIFCAESILIVTQKYHLYRSLYIARGLGISSFGVASDKAVYRGFVYREIRESAARVKDFFSILFKPRPTFLGEIIPVSGNGNTTNDK